MDIFPRNAIFKSTTMNRRLLLGIAGLSPLALISAKIPAADALVPILINRWKSSRQYTLEVFDTMPADSIEYTPTAEQMTFAQHFLHLSFINNMYLGILLDSKTYPGFDTLMEAEFFIDRPDPINLFQPDKLAERDAAANKGLVYAYIAETFDYVISSLDRVSDDMLARGANKEKPEFLANHTNLDLIVRGEGHTAHHRAQAIGYLRMNGIRPPGYTVNNKL